MIRAFQWDLARQVERLDWLLAQLPRYSRWGYEELHLHLEDAVDYPSLPGVARRDAFSWAQLRQLVDTAATHGIRVVPIVNLLGHTQYLIKTETWRDLNELRDDAGDPLVQGQICPSLPRSREVARRLIADVAPLCTAGKVHVGLDESFLLGRHPASRAEVAEMGLARYFASWVAALHGIAAEHDLRTAIWADMLALLPAAIPHLPRGLIAYDWYYHGFGRLPRFEAQNFRPYDLAPALKEQGVAYWGCPMNGAFRYEPLPVFGDRMANALAWWKRCESVGAEGFLVTGWEPFRLALPTTVVVDAAIAGLWLDAGPHDQVSLLQGGFARVHGKRHAPEFARQMLAADERAFAGYARWETHERWDTVHGREGPAPYAADERYFSRAAGTRHLPHVFRDSLEWRGYLAARDRFIRDMVARTFRARRLRHRGRHKTLRALIVATQAEIDAFGPQLDAGERAAKRMWLATRSASQPNPNARILQADRKRWSEVRHWWKQAGNCHDNLDTTSPVVGAWQVQALVHTTRPNLQAVVVQVQEADGTWRDAHQRYLIEFRTFAARRTANIRHWLSLPLPDRNTPVRFALRGLGQFALSDVHLTNGIVEYRPQGPAGRLRRRVTLGQLMDNASILEVDRTRNRDVWQPTWRPVRDV